MNRRSTVLFLSLALCASPASAQLVLPGAGPSAPAGTPAAAAKPKKASGASKGGSATGVSKTPAKAAKIASPGVASIDGQPLLLNGQTGVLQISGDGKTLQIDKLRLAGESPSDPSQRCIVDIVGEKPIEATSAGTPDGLERYEADVPACPFAFDVLNGAVLAPSQITACVFKAADCQTSPGGLWGPDAAALDKDAASIAKRRMQAEKAMGAALHVLEERAQNSPDAASLLRDQNGFPGARDDACRSYVRESTIGYCATSLTEARSALLEARLAALAPASGATAEKNKPEKKKTAKKKPKADAAAAQ
jgi:hypothetical protein